MAKEIDLDSSFDTENPDAKSNDLLSEPNFDPMRRKLEMTAAN